MFRLKRFSCLLLLAVLVLPVFAEETTEMGFGFDLGIGVESFDEPGQTEPVTYQTLTLSPDFAIGPFGIGLDVTIHYNFTPSDDGNFEIRTADWVPDENNSFLDLYLPLFRYIRWGFRGDPLYVKLGSIDDATLGNGFIMGNYANTLFLPEVRIFGLNFDLDARLFKFPYVGMQSFVGNLANPDVIGGRVFVRPLAWMSMPILPYLEIGYTMAGDLDPFYYTPGIDVDGDLVADSGTAFMQGIDFKLPLLSSKVISLATFGDVVFQNTSTGGMIGLGGQLFSFLPFGLQARFLGPNFVPAYFGVTYDVYRPYLHAIYSATDEVIPESVGWFATTGLSFLEGMLAFNASIDGPFAKPLPDLPDDDPKAWVNYPHLRATLLVGEGLLPGFDFYASYDKKNIRAWADLISAEDAVIGAAINYTTGPAVITLEYDIRYLPATNEFDTTAKLKSSISIF